jgi:hypothetical protein
MIFMFEKTSMKTNASGEPVKYAYKRNTWKSLNVMKTKLHAKITWLRNLAKDFSWLRYVLEALTMLGA